MTENKTYSDEAQKTWQQYLEAVKRPEEQVKTWSWKTVEASAPYLSLSSIEQGDVEYYWKRLQAPAAPSPDSAQVLKILEFIGKETVIQKRKRLDVWTPSKRSMKEQADFKDKLIAFYKRDDPKDPNMLFCMVLNRGYPRVNIRAAHIWKHATHGEGLEEFQLDASDISSERNGFLLAEAIEGAFDSKQLCFLYNPLQQNLVCCVLDPSILENYVTPSTTTKFRDIDGKPLVHPPGCMPFRRLLSWHAQCSFNVALRRKWIDDTKFQTFKDFHSLSEGASIPDFNDIE